MNHEIKILIIDDEPTLRNPSDRLERFGIRDQRSQNRRGRVKALRRPRISFSDHWLPESTAIRSHRIKENVRRSLLLLVTAQGSIELAAQLMKMGPSFFWWPSRAGKSRPGPKALEESSLRREVQWLRSIRKIPGDRRQSKMKQVLSWPKIGSGFRHDRSDRRRRNGTERNSWPSISILSPHLLPVPP
jgi:hypothetical protein